MMVWAGMLSRVIVLFWVSVATVARCILGPFASCSISIRRFRAPTERARIRNLMRAPLSLISFGAFRLCSDWFIE